MVVTYKFTVLKHAVLGHIFPQENNQKEPLSWISRMYRISSRSVYNFITVI